MASANQRCVIVGVLIVLILFAQDDGFAQRPAGPPKPQEAAAAQPSLTNFSSLGPGGGGVFAAVFHNTNPDIMLIGQDIGGIGKSTDGGRTWRHVNQGGISLPGVTAGVYTTSEIIAHPTDDDVFFAAMGVGLYRSDDVGETWTRLIPDDPLDVSVLPMSWLAFSPVTPGLALAGSGDWHEPDIGFGIYRSTDDGNSFTKIAAAGIPAAAVITAIAFDPADGSAFAATSAGLFRSTDSGDSFTKLGFAFRHDQGQWIGIGGSAEQRTFWYVLQTFGEEGNEANWSGGVYRSNDGVSWTEIDSVPRFLADTDEILRAMGSRLHPANAEILYHNLRTNEGLGGTYRYDGTWTNLTAGFLEDTWPDSFQFFMVAPEGLAISPSDPSRILSCNELALLLSTDGGASWQQLSSRQVGPNTYSGAGTEVTDVFDLAISGGVLYQSIEDIGIWRSDDRGASWQQVLWRPGPTEVNGGSDIRAHPSDPNRAYFAASSWSNSLREGDAASEIHMTTDGGQTTTNITPPGTPIPLGRAAMAVLFGATQAQDTLYVAFHGNTIYKSTDGGATWREISNGMSTEERQVIYSLAVDPADSNSVWAGLFNDIQSTLGGPFGTAEGLLHSSNGGESWQRAEGYPHPEVVAVRFAGSPARLFVGGWSVDEADVAAGALMVSNDGVTFVEVLSQAFTFDVIDAAGAPGSLYAAVSITYGSAHNHNSGIYRSTDNGATWARLQGALPHNFMHRLAMFPDEPERLLMATGGDGLIAANNSPAGAPPTATNLQADIKADGSDDAVQAGSLSAVSFTVSLDAAGLDGQNADWWVAATTPAGLHWFTLEGGWQSSETPRRVFGGPLFSLPTFDLPTTGLPTKAGAYTLFFGVETSFNNSLDFDQLIFDSVSVTID